MPSDLGAATFTVAGVARRVPGTRLASGRT